MVYITGDSHGKLQKFTDIESQSTINKNDKVIICGDFGFIMGTNNQPELLKLEEQQLNILSKKPYEILFVCGNHENFNRLKNYPIETRYGGNVRKIKDNIFLLMRGNIFTIEEKTFFALGGAYSTGRFNQIKNEQWWEEELPSKEECNLAIDNLKKYNYKVDYIITHNPPQSAMVKLGFFSCQKELPFALFLNSIFQKATFKNWFFGHRHIDKQVDQKTIGVYNKIYKV